MTSIQFVTVGGGAELVIFFLLDKTFKVPYLHVLDNDLEVMSASGAFV